MIPHVNGQQENIIDEDDIPFALDNHKNLKWYDRVLLNRPLRIIIVLLIATIAAPVLMYKFLFVPTIELPPPDGLSIGSCLVSREARLPCGLEAVPPLQCHEQCCYDHQHNLCYHRYPSRFSYLFRGDWTEETELYPRMLTLPYAAEKSYRNIKLSIDEISATHLSFTFYHSNNITGRRLTNKNYEYSISEPNHRYPDITELNIVVNATQGNIFNTARGPLMAANNIWEMTFKLTNETMYGLGEIPLKPNTVKVLYNHKGGLNSVPLIIAKLNGSYHGLLIESLAPTEVIIRGDNQVVLRSITTFGLKFHLFVGPTPRDVMKDVRAVIGVKKDLEYWMLGAHICREGTSNDPLAELTTFLSSATTDKLPFESHCGTLPVVFQTDCNDTMVELVNQGETLLRNAGKKFVPHVSPYIKYTALEQSEEEGSQEDSEEGTTLTTTTTTTAIPIERCFDDEQLGHYNIRDPNANHLYKGKVDQQNVVYPGYYWASEEFMQNLWIYNTNFDAVILENNWPLDESEKDRDSFYDFLPYFNENFEAAFNVTPQWNATRPTRRPDIRRKGHTNVTEYPGEQYLMRHNEYGNQFIQAMEKIKGPVPMASTTQWMNGNVTINRQNITTTWTNLRRELVEASLGGVSGHWYWSSPICGDTEDFNNVTQVRLCAKWYMAATFMPMIKIHSKGIPRDPLGFVGNDRAHMIQALNRRLSLLPYIYTVLQDGPLLRPMFYQFPSSNLTDLTTQFAFGDDLVIVPNLEPNQINVHFWMPPGEWYEFWGGLKINGAEGHAVTMSTTEADIFTMVRAGSIIIMQKETQLTANITRLQSGYSLIIALECETTYSTQTTTETDSTESTITTEDDGNTSATETTDVSTENDVTTERNDSTVGTETTANTDEDDTFSTTTEIPMIAVTNCEATGKLFMNENMTLIFKANATDVTVTAEYIEKEDFDVFCNATIATWAGSVRELAIYGLNITENNYDDKKLITSTTPLIDLCQLVDSDEVSYKFVD